MKKRTAASELERKSLREVSDVEWGAAQVNVRAAKDQLSKLLELASRGSEIVITSDGQPKARLVPMHAERRPFRMDWEWLGTQPVNLGAGVSEAVRADRDSRG